MLQTPPSDSSSGPPESPWHVELRLFVNCVCSVSDDTTVMIAEPARNVAAIWV